MTFEEIKEWLDAEGFGEYFELFKKANITAEQVAFLEDSHFKEIGVVKVGHRIRLRNTAKRFRRNMKTYERSNVQLNLADWYWRPVMYYRTYQITAASIIVHNPHPWQCTTTIDQVDMSTVRDINMREWMGFLGYVEVLSTDKRVPRIVLTLRLHKAREVFDVIRNLWEDDQYRMGMGGAAVAKP